MSGEKFYTTLAEYYDRIYHFVDYEKQANYFVELIDKFKLSKGRKILDVCCGTGTHIGLLGNRGFEVTGVDISREMLTQASKKYPNIKFIEGDMRKLELGEKFDIIICFFNSILYNETLVELRTTLFNFHNHLYPGGILLFDMVDKEIGIDSKKETFIYEDEDIKITFSPQWVYNTHQDIMDLNVWFTIERTGNTEKLFDYHRMGAFSFNEMRLLLSDIGFEVNILKRDFDNVIEFDFTSKRANFVARKT